MNQENNDFNNYDFDNLNNSNNNLPPNPNERRMNGMHGSTGNGELTGIAKAGLIINIVIAGIACVSAFFWGLGMGAAVPVAIGTIAALVVSIIALSKKTNGILITAGILGILFSGLIGGILVLCGLNKK